MSESNLPLISITREYGNGIATVKYPSGSVYEYYGIEPPAYNKIRSVLYNKKFSQNVKASIILKKLKAGEKAGNYKVTKISEENVMDKIDKVVNKVIKEQGFGINTEESDIAPVSDLVSELADRIHDFCTEYGDNYREIIMDLADELDVKFGEEMPQ